MREGRKQTNSEMGAQGRKDKRKIVKISAVAFRHECTNDYYV